MNKKILINQPGFIGDIIFVMAIAQDYARKGYEVIIPVFSEYLESPSIEKYFPEIIFISIDEFPIPKQYIFSYYPIEDNEYIYLPLSLSPDRGGDEHMKYKYELLGLDFNSWRNIEIIRDYDAENRLLEFLRIEDEISFNLVNEFHMCHFEKVTIPVNENEKNIYMSKIDGFGLFDWMGVMEKAKSIHTVGTSIVFLMDAFDTMPEEMHLYPRNDKPHSTYDFLLKKNYIYH